eukprot:3332010-Pleurochrysis_carterae.AAC.2
MQTSVSLLMPSMPFFESYRELLSTFPVWRALQAVKRFEKQEFQSLRELGTVLNAGEVNASFVPFEDLTLPITVQAALKLPRCFRAQRGEGKPCVYKKAAMLLGRASLQKTLRVAEGTFDKHNKKTSAREPLGNYLLSAWPAPASSSSSASASASAGIDRYTVVKPVGKTSEQRAV